VKKTISQQIGQVIRDLRLEAGLSQVEFSDKCGFYQTYLSRIENGKANPTVNALEVIASGLGITIFKLWEMTQKRASEGIAKGNPD
jgi:transcriptional regulator with XRE-family HTH domain